MPIVQAQVVLPMDSGIPGDAAINTFHFNVEEPLAVPLQTISDAIEDFYMATTVGGAGTLDRIAGFLSSHIGPTAEVKFYNLADPQPRVPVFEDTFPLTIPTGAPLPQEVAFVLSFQGTPQSGQSQARRRGRVYIGPLGFNAQAVAPEGRPPNALRTAVVNAGSRLRAASVADALWTWGIWSRAGLTFTAVNNGWVDDAWDTQRRRGLDPTARTTFS